MRHENPSLRERGSGGSWAFVLLPDEPQLFGMVAERAVGQAEQLGGTFLLALSPVESLATNKAQAVFGSASATIHFIIRRDGTILQPFLQEPSGWSLYDRSVERAVQATRARHPAVHAPPQVLRGVAHPHEIFASKESGFIDEWQNDIT